MNSIDKAIIYSFSPESCPPSRVMQLLLPAKPHEWLNLLLSEQLISQLSIVFHAVWLDQMPHKNPFQRAVTFPKGCCETNLSVNLKCKITWAHVPRLTPLFCKRWPLKFRMSQPYLSNAHRPSRSSSYNFFCFLQRNIIF